MSDAEITESDIRDLKRSWGDKWRQHTAGKVEAVEKGNLLLAKMNGEGWELRVHENLGWHFNVSNGNLYVHESSSGRSSCLMSDGEYAGAGTGLGLWTTNDYYEDPNEAVAKQVEVATAVVARLVKAVEQAKAIVKEVK